MYDAQGVPFPWTGTTRFELVLPPDIFKETGRNYVWVRPGRKNQYQKITRPRDFLFEYRSTIGEHKKRQEILKWQQRKKDIDEAIAKRSLLRVPVDPSNYTIPAASVKHRPPFTGTDDDDGPIPHLTDESDDESYVA